jgi:hypothetical protein
MALMFFLCKDLLAEIIFWNDLPENFEHVIASKIFPKQFPLQRKWLDESSLKRNDRGGIVSINDKYHSIGDHPCPSPHPLDYAYGWGWTWYKNGNLHRDFDRPASIFQDGTQEWMQNGLYDRKCDKPSCIEFSGCREWRKDNLLHRAHGKPARVFAGGEKQWWINGEFKGGVLI